MTDAVYRIVEHDGGWAYKLGDVFSETFPNRRAAESAATRVARQQQLAGEGEAISWEDEAGAWHDETVEGTDRPQAYVAGAADAISAPSRRAAPAGGPGDQVLAAYDRGDDVARRGMRVARARVRSDPLLAMLVAALGGFVLGMLLGRADGGGRPV